MKTVMAIVVLCISLNVFAISEDNYKQEYQEKIVPTILAFQNATFTGQKNISIHYATYTTNDQTNRCLVILPGRTEALEKYAEVVYDLDNGVLAGEFKYFLMDHRGQGSSGRMVADTQKGHVDSFNNYVLDLKQFMDTVVKDANCSEVNLIAHSLGAGIATNFLQTYPDYFKRAALSSPMLKIQTAPYKYELARAIVLASMIAGKGKDYGVGQKPFDPTRNFVTNTFTTSEVRYDMAMDIFDEYRQAKLGGVTNQWLNEVMHSTFSIRLNYKKIKIPLRVFHAGLESYSEPSEMIRLCKEASDCSRTFLPTAKHEVLMDRDVNRGVVISELEKFLTN
jgi:lysophospholipase